MISFLLQKKGKMGVAADYVSRTRIGAYFHSMRESRKLILFIVAVALLLDNMLLTTVGQYSLQKIAPKIMRESFLSNSL